MFIDVDYSYSDNIDSIKDIINNLPNIIACDFEAANKLTEEQIKELSKTNYNILTDNINQMINANGLSHPSLTTITHYSVAWANNKSFVCICSTKEIKQYIYNFLTTTDKLQIWHNACFDFSHIYYNTNKIPINFEDTMLLAKCLRNNANSFKAKVGLKDLMGSYYGAWGQALEANFTLKDMYDSTMLKYAATDSAATFKLYEIEQEYLKSKGYINYDN